MLQLSTSDSAILNEERLASRRDIPLILLPDSPYMILESKFFPKTFSDGDINIFNQHFIEELENIRQIVEHHGNDLRGQKEINNSIKSLCAIGKAAHNKFLTKPARESILEIEQMEGERGISLTFRTPPNQSFLWEMLYSGSPNQTDLENVWGFRYPIGRLFWETNTSDHLHFQNGLFSFIHDKLKYSKQEAQIIRSLVNKLNREYSLNFQVRLLDDVETGRKWSIENLVEFFHSDNFRYGMVHFACHCEDSIEKGSSKANLRLTVYGEDLSLKLEELLIWQEYGFIFKPFVFLNACQSSTLGHLLETTSFPSEFLNFGAGGVIATACTIPDHFASAFASEFYKRLLNQAIEKRSANIGEVLLQTRLHFLRSYNNPLGLAYGLYAFANQRLTLET